MTEQPTEDQEPTWCQNVEDFEGWLATLVAVDSAAIRARFQDLAAEADQHIEAAREVCDRAEAVRAQVFAEHWPGLESRHDDIAGAFRCALEDAIGFNEINHGAMIILDYEPVNEDAKEDAAAPPAKASREENTDDAQ